MPKQKAAVNADEIKINEHYFNPKRFSELRASGVHIKIGKITVKEKSIVEEKVKEFLVDNGFTWDDLASFLIHYKRTEEHKKLSKLFLYVAKFLPGRYANTVNQYIKRRYNPLNYNGKWTKEEDDLLVNLYSSLGNNWTEIGREINRTGVNCNDRLRYILSQTRVEKEKTYGWSVDEMEKLVACVKEFHKEFGHNTAINWKYIETKMHTKSEMQCKSHWMRGLFNKSEDMEVTVWLYYNVTHFSIEEDMLLLNALKSGDFFHEKDIMWNLITLHIPNRMPEYVIRRWQQLKKMLPSVHSFTNFDDLLDAIISRVTKSSAQPKESNN